MTVLIVLCLFFTPVIIARAARLLMLRTPDNAIGPLIEANRARPRPGMEAPDWARIHMWGARNAETVKRAEERVH